MGEITPVLVVGPHVPKATAVSVSNGLIGCGYQAASDSRGVIDLASAALHPFANLILAEARQWWGTNCALSG